MSERIKETAEVFEAIQRFGWAELEATLGEPDERGVRRGSGHAHLSGYDRSRQVDRSLEVKLRDGRHLTLVFETWDSRKSTGRVRLLEIPKRR